MLTESKENSLDEQISHIQQTLSNAGFMIIERSALIPEINIWSTKIRDDDYPLLFTKGHGISKQTALLSALEEFIKNISTHHLWSDYYLGDDLSKNKYIHFPQEIWFKTHASNSWPKDNFDNEILNEELQNFYNPDSELNISNLIDINSSNRERGICCIPYLSIRTNKKINFPLNIITNLYSNNGMAIGNTKEEAQLKALSEIIKNYVRFKVIAEELCLPDIPLTVLQRYPEILKITSTLEADDYSLTFKDASLGNQYPVVAIILMNNKNQKISMCFGAHSVFQIALKQTVDEFIHSQFINISDESFEAGFDIDEISSPQNLAKHFNCSQGIVSWKALKNTPDFEFVDWDKKDNIEEIKIYANEHQKHYEQLCNLIHAEGNDIHVFNHQTMGVNTCNIIVPGMSEVYPVDDLVWENNNSGIDVREQVLNQNKTLKECEQLILDLENLGQDDECLVSKIIGMPSDQNNIFDDLTLNELITLLALKTQDNERIQEGCEWLLHYQQFNPYRLKVYHCINALLQLDKMAEYSSALEQLYTKEILSDALALLDGEDVFPIISQWNTYKSLIDVYEKAINMVR